MQKHRKTASFLFVLGYILSPLSWWNDSFINIPIAYLFSMPFTLLNKRFFLPSFILGYWISNILGLVLMHKGVKGFVNSPPLKYDIVNNIIISMAYTALVIILVFMGWIKPPVDFLQ